MGHCQGPIQSMAIGEIVPHKSSESIFTHYDFLQFRKQHVRYKTISSSIVLSQQFCEVFFISLTVAKPL